MKKIFYAYLILVCAVSIGFAVYMPLGLIFLVLALPLSIIGLRDVLQNSHAIRKNYPIVGNLRYLFEEIRPEINQYFVESNTDGKPFSREQRSIVYQRAKKQVDTIQIYLFISKVVLIAEPTNTLAICKESQITYNLAPKRCIHDAC